MLTLAAAFTALGVVPGSPIATAQAACADADLSVTSGETARLRAATLCLVNAARRANAVPTVRAEPQLQQAAQGHTDDMVARRYFEHEAPPPAPATAADRAAAAGYQRAWIAENLAAGLGTPRETVDGWLRSPGHCANLLSSQPIDVGVGVRAEPPQGDYAPGTWTMTYGRRSGVSAPVAGDGECPTALPADVGGSPAGAGSTVGTGLDGSGSAAGGSASGNVPVGGPVAALLGGGLRFVAAPSQRRGSRRVTARVRCARRSGVCRSMVYVTIRVRRKVVSLASRQLALRAGRTITLRTTVTPAGGRRLDRARSLAALMSFRAAGSTQLSRRLTLRAAPRS